MRKSWIVVWPSQPRFEQLALAVWTSPMASALIATGVYTLVAGAFGPVGLGQSRVAYFVYLADAFLHGHLDLISLPPIHLDLSLYKGHYYLYWPPFPALLFMPLVAALGTGISDAPLSLISSGLNVWLVSTLLAALDEKGIARLSPAKRAWLTLFFAFGTVHVTLATNPSVWFTSQVIGFSLLCGAYIVALRLPRSWSPLVSGTLIGCVLLTRDSMVLAGGWIVWYLIISRDRADRYSLARIFLGVVAPVAAAAALLAVYNYLRFGNPMETGLAYHQMNPVFRDNYDKYGVFSLHYLPSNLYYDFLYFPYWRLLRGSVDLSFFYGGSLFLLSPALFLSVIGVLRQWRSNGWALAASCVLGFAPALLVMGPGVVQFGPRYSLDIAVPLLVAAAVGATSVSTRVLRWLCLISLAMYLPGAIFLRATGVIG